jgi:aspergillopepsin I
MSYADGSGSSGDVYIDRVTVGGITVTKQAIESAETISSVFSSNSASSSLLVLALDSINAVSPRQNTFFANAKSSLAMPIFNANLKKDKAGNYNFGFIDKTEHMGAISYTPFNPANGLWQFTGSGFAVGHGAFQNFSIKAIADTGTTLLLMPDTVVSAYYPQVEEAVYDYQNSGYVFPCSSSLPDFTFRIGVYSGVVPRWYMNYAPVGTSNTTCYGGLQSSDVVGFAIYVDILLKSQL